MTPTAPASASVACPPWGRGWGAALACHLEATARKPGNVHPRAEFVDLSHAELLAAGSAIAPAMESAPLRPLGRTILAAVTASRAVTRSNANLGIVLAVAPLAAVPDSSAVCPERIAAVLDALGPNDAHDIWRAIALARPGGMGRQQRWDLADAPPSNILDAMRVAAERDQIARLWAQGYRPLFDGLVRDIDDELRAGRPLGDAIVRSYLRQLSREPDSLVARKHGVTVATAVSARAADVLAAAQPDWIAAAAAFDAWLRTGRVNPGTTADLVAAALYILATTGRLRELVGLQPTIDSTVMEPA